MNQNQQSQDFKCRDHSDNPVILWCKSSDCKENRIFCLDCQKENKHAKHHDQDVLSIHGLNQFLIDRSNQFKVFISECDIQFQSTAKSYYKLINGLSYKFCGLEDKITQFKPYQLQQALDSLIRFNEFRDNLKENVLGSLYKLQKILDDHFIQLELQTISLFLSYI